MREQKLDQAAETLVKAINKGTINSSQMVEFSDIRGAVELIADAGQIYEVYGIESRKVRNHNEGAC